SSFSRKRLHNPADSCPSPCPITVMGAASTPHFVVQDTGSNHVEAAMGGTEEEEDEEDASKRPQWSNSLEFLMSCIAMSVGLGNIWRFPYTAFKNGGGAFLIPYIIVLFIIGKPLYYMEMALGQFIAGGPVKVWNLSPALRGLAFYFIQSFSAELPWATCKPEWGPNCFNSSEGNINGTLNLTHVQSSTELYFYKEVLREKDNIDDGIGDPDWRLTLCLLFSWIVIFLVIVRGVKSSGKASYFLALFPYVVMIALLVRGVTLPGAGQGILYFIEPQWEELLNARVWYSAVTQAFFSLNICFGTLIMYSSYNEFGHMFTVKSSYCALNGTVSLVATEYLTQKETRLWNL
ncbi:hypothetical protein L9F63_006625, partial [Diploptera punctata]